MVLMSIVAILATNSIVAPIEGFMDVSRRAALVDEAQLAMNRMSREIRLALPNSVRITDGTAPPSLSVCVATAGSSCTVEILRTLDGSRYREDVDSLAAGDTLDFTAATDTFDVLGMLPNVQDVDDGAGSLNDCLTGVADCLVIYNLGFSGADAYNGDNIAGIVGDGDLDNNGTLESPIQFIRGSAFPFSSPNQRFHIVDMPVSYECNTTTGRINRHEDYTITSAQALVPGGTTNVLAANVSSCIFRYSQGSGSRNAVLTIELVISQFNQSIGADENIRLVNQIRVPNIP